MPSHFSKLATFATALLTSVAAAEAVDVSFWTHASSEDHAEARLENVVVTNYGVVRLARATTPLSVDFANAGGAYAATRLSDGRIAIGTGPEGLLLIASRDGEEAARRVSVDSLTHIFALFELSPDRLLVGGLATDPQGGDAASLVEVNLSDEEPQITPRLTADDAGYVWDIRKSPADDLLVAAGTPARVFRLDDDETQVVFEAPGEENALSLAFDPAGRLLVGTTPGGLVWRVHDGGEARVLFDAPEPDIVAMTVMENVLYIAASAEAGAGVSDLDGEGRPDVRLPGVPLAGDREDLPEVPDLPPGAPDRIPLDPADDVPHPAEEAQALDPDDDEAFPGEAGPTRGPTGSGFGPVAELAEGSGVYRIDLSRDRLGLVTDVLREPGTFFDMVDDGDRLILAAGPAMDAESASRVFAFDIRTGETTLLAVPPAGVAAVLSSGEAEEALLIGTVGPAGALSMGDELADEGTLTSEPLDAGAVSRFGTIQLVGSLPEATELLLSVRTGNAQDPEANTTAWSDWSEPMSARQFLAPDAPPARFFQYRLTLRSGGSSTPELERLRVAYQLPNLPPRVTSVQVRSELTNQDVAAIAAAALEAQQAPSAIRAVEWEAEDPNQDTLRYDLLYRKSRRGDFSLLTSDLEEPEYAWDTKATGEGTYEFQVIARDARSNPPGQELTSSRVSEPVVVDLSPPRIGDVTVGQEEGEIVVSLRVADARGIVARLEYQVAGGAEAADPARAGQWNRLFPEDTMSDSPQERYRLALPREAAGGTLRLRAVDDAGNLAYTSVVLRIAD